MAAMSPTHAATTLAEAYDLGLPYMRNKRLPAGAPQPLPTEYWPKGNLEFLEEYRAWLAEGGVSEAVVQLYHVKMASHVLALTLKPYGQLDPEKDLACAFEYIQVRGLGASWTKNCKNSLVQFRRFLRLKRGLGEERQITSFNIPGYTQGLPAWLVSELERYQHLCQRNWRTARLDLNLRGFWNKYGRLWLFLCPERGVTHLADLKRQFILDYVDRRLAEGRAAKTINGELRCLRSFVLFLQEEGYAVPQSLLRMPNLKEPDSLPKYLTDEQVKKLRDEIERGVREARSASHKRLALLVRAAFYLLWQGGLRLGEVEELRLEDLDLASKRLTVRNGKGMKDRTIYFTETNVLVLREYLAMRGAGSSDHVFLYRNAPLKKDLIRAQLKYAGERVGVKVHPHRLRHTCATQLLNAGCRITSIQAFLGHKKLNTTMIYARAHDQTVAEDYFAAMQRVEQRLEIIPAPGEPESPTHDLPAQVEQPLENGIKDEVVKVQDRERFLAWVELLSRPVLRKSERLEITTALKKALLGFDAAMPAPPG
jgi:site-specific recombinase XerD